ncbi:MAG: hypothetical protein B7Z60_07110 [Ferrovum sp. 37-45-19]|nr:MAG: hypothetical protein B7Z65_07075 [Ferrovum sp. 21-44-67]OYV93851.1 MAG: hypothetical protein B7Z60_07110 [Ferrovum sp. 37-45-19]OZB32150.1 MAG: hypothetical protein B7X47_07265 [Ferrovum sp. 34-44-207]
MREAQMQLGHENMRMTEHYIRSRRGRKSPQLARKPIGYVQSEDGIEIFQVESRPNHRDWKLAV